LRNRSCKTVHPTAQLVIFAGMESVIDIKNLYKIYQVGTQEVRALNGVSISINRNEYVALMGPSGSGKSTLMNILGCLDSPSLVDEQGNVTSVVNDEREDASHYRLGGKNVSLLDDNELAEIRNKQIGFVFQTFNLLPRYTALDNVSLPLIYAGFAKEDRNERATEVLTQVNLEDRMNHKPNELSGGQRQRVAIARALVNKPAIILADEPTGNLDSKTSVEIMALFDDIQANGNTIILVTHEEDIAQYAHRIIRLRDGKVESDELTARAHAK
jgi:putative ABC transport system ATP-binding protein